jgi:hypothetical protein
MRRSSPARRQALPAPRPAGSGPPAGGACSGSRSRWPRAAPGGEQPRHGLVGGARRPASAPRPPPAAPGVERGVEDRAGQRFAQPADGNDLGRSEVVSRHGQPFEHRDRGVVEVDEPRSDRGHALGAAPRASSSSKNGLPRPRGPRLPRHRARPARPRGPAPRRRRDRAAPARCRARSRPGRGALRREPGHQAPGPAGARGRRTAGPRTPLPGVRARRSSPRRRGARRPPRAGHRRLRRRRAGRGGARRSPGVRSGSST